MKILLLRLLGLAFACALGPTTQAQTAAPSVALIVEVRGLDNGTLTAGDPVRVGVALVPAGDNNAIRLAMPDGIPWRAAVRVRLHREDGRAIGEPAQLGGSLGPSDIEFTAESPAAGIWRWPGRVTAELPPGVYRVSARLLAPPTADGTTPPPLAVAETQFALAAAPETMTPAQRVRWHHLLAMDAFLARDRERARRLNAAVLAAEPTHPEGLRLKAVLERPDVPEPTVTAAAAHTAEPMNAPPALAPPPRQPEPALPSAKPAPPAAAATDPVVRWATSARASSQYDVNRWGAANAVGAPNVNRYGDSPESWTPRTESAGEEWLELSYDPAVDGATGVRVVQNFNPGALMKVELVAPDGTKTTVWTGPDTTAYPPNAVAVFETRFARSEKPVAAVKLTFDTKRVRGWKEVDAVGLLMSPVTQPPTTDIVVPGG